MKILNILKSWYADENLLKDIIQPMSKFNSSRSCLLEVCYDKAVIRGRVRDVLEGGQLPLLQKGRGTQDIVDTGVEPEETHESSAY